MNNQIWIMSSAFDQLGLDGVIQKAVEIGVQGLDLCVFRKDGTRDDFVATHLDYDNFSLNGAKTILDEFNQAGLQLSLGAFENLIGGDPEHKLKNQDHLLKLIRIDHLMGGDDNDIKVGTFVGFNHELGALENGFERNLEEYKKVFTPIVAYAESLGVTLLYENCPMEGWRKAGYTGTYNNLPGVLAARKLMYEIIPSKAHGEIYDPSHDVWQHTDPSEVIRHTDMERLHRIHVKSTRRGNSVFWGNMYPMQLVDKGLAQKAGVPTCSNDWDRHHYEATLPGFGVGDSLDWRGFINTLHEKGFEGPFEIENEAVLSKGTGNMGAIVQGFKATVLNLSPILWPMTDEGYAYDKKGIREMKSVATKEIPVKRMEDLLK